MYDNKEALICSTFICTSNQHNFMILFMVENAKKTNKVINYAIQLLHIIIFHWDSCSVATPVVVLVPVVPARNNT